MKWQSGVYKGIGKCSITEKEKRDLEELGIVGKLMQAKQERDNAKEKNDKAKELEEELTVELKKRGNIREK